MKSPKLTWKEKAILRRNKLKQARKRLDEARQSRDNWKKKYQALKKKLKELKKENEKLKKKAQFGSPIGERITYPKRYHYPIYMIRLSLALKLRTSASFRMIHLFFVQLQICWHLKLEPPTSTSITIWVLKLGYALLNRSKEKSTDWVIILDESIVLGSAKLLVIYGFRLSSVTFERPLQLQDLTPLHIQSQTSWTGDKIETILSKLQSELGIIRYAVADYGAAIKKGLRLTQIIHVYDLTHKIASILQAIYKDDPEFVEYTKQMAQMRTKLSLSTVAHIIPPNQRTKSRFLNLNILAQWGMNVLNYLEGPTSEQSDNVREKLAWVQSKEVLIRELDQIQMAICQLETLLKTKGLSRETFSQCQDILKNCTSGKALYFKEQCQKYLQEILALLPEEKNICCSSDIIESAFGKYKNYLSQNLMIGITPLALCLAAFTSSLTETEIIQALENTTIQDVKIWAAQNIGTTLLTKRRKVFRKNGANF